MLYFLIRRKHTKTAEKKKQEGDGETPQVEISGSGAKDFANLPLRLTSEEGPREKKVTCNVRLEEKGAAEDEMVGRHHLNGP